MRARVLVIGVIIAALIAISVYWIACRDGHGATMPGRQGPGASVGSDVGDRARASPDARAAAPAHRQAHTAAERAALLEAIATARSRRAAAPAASGAPARASGGGGSGDTNATTLNITDRTGDTSEWEKRTLGTLNTLLGECYDLGRAEAPGLDGTVVLRFTIAGEPNVGGLLERVEIVDENTTIKQQTLRDCMTESLYALELDPPPDGVRVEREISLRFP